MEPTRRLRALAEFLAVVEKLGMARRATRALAAIQKTTGTASGQASVAMSANDPIICTIKLGNTQTATASCCLTDDATCAIRVATCPANRS